MFVQPSVAADSDINQASSSYSSSFSINGDSSTQVFPSIVAGISACPESASSVKISSSLNWVENVKPRLDVCNFCRISAPPNSEHLIRCPYCKVVAYCGAEHKNFDWKRHKILCYQWRRRPEDCESSASSAFSNSCDTSSSSLTSSSAFTFSHPFLSSSECSEAKSSGEERLIETDDPDIQIVEGGSSVMDSHQKTRKRALNSNGRVYKDHSKNLLFKITFQEHVKSLMDRGMVVNQHQATVLRIKYIAEHVIRSLNEYGWAVVDNFLGKRHCSKTYQEVEDLYEKGMFTAGQLMDGGKYDLNPQEIRSDRIFWFSNDDNCEYVKKSVTIRLLISMIDSVVVRFRNRIPPFEIAGRSKAMIAVYPGNGTRYVKHVDNPAKDGRCFTTIYYCNDNWKLAEHGGTLRLYPETSEVPMDVDPQADRLVFFWSDKRVPHEVLPVFRHRYAITIWYFDVYERRKALQNRNGGVDENSAAAASKVNASSNSHRAAAVSVDKDESNKGNDELNRPSTVGDDSPSLSGGLVVPPKRKNPGLRGDADPTLIRQPEKESVGNLATALANRHLQQQAESDSGFSDIANGTLADCRSNHRVASDARSIAATTTSSSSNGDLRKHREVFHDEDDEEDNDIDNMVAQVIAARQSTDNFEI